MEKHVIVLERVNDTYGAPFGRPDIDHGVAFLQEGATVWLAEVPFIDDCYDIGGAYWGAGVTLWVAEYGPAIEPESGAEVYIRLFERASCYEQAVSRFREQLGSKVEFIQTETNTWQVLAQDIGAEIFEQDDGYGWRTLYGPDRSMSGFETMREAYDSLIDYAQVDSDEDD